MSPPESVRTAKSGSGSGSSPPTTPVRHRHQYQPRRALESDKKRRYQSLPDTPDTMEPAQSTREYSNSMMQISPAYRCNAPRSLVSSNWRQPQSHASLDSWLSRESRDYLLTNSPSISRADVADGVLSGYAYCLDRGNGQYTRLIPADMLPPLNEMPQRQAGPGGMVILPNLQTPPPQGVAETNRPVTIKVSGAIQKQIDRIVATSSLTPKRTKVYCDKWVHEGVCAFTQQGCKYKHEMPYDTATQHSLGLFHGFPAWWKKQQANLQRQHDQGGGGSSSPRRGSTQFTRGVPGTAGRPASLMLIQPQQHGWCQENSVKMPGLPTSSESPDDGPGPLHSLSTNPSPTRGSVWGPIERPQKSYRGSYSRSSA